MLICVLWLTPDLLVCICAVEGVVADETVSQLHRHRTPPELHCAAGDLLHLHCRTSWGCCAGRQIKTGGVKALIYFSILQQLIWLSFICYNQLKEFYLVCQWIFGQSLLVTIFIKGILCYNYYMINIVSSQQQVVLIWTTVLIQHTSSGMNQQNYHENSSWNWFSTILVLSYACCSIKSWDIMKVISLGRCSSPVSEIMIETTSMSVWGTT